MAANAIPTTEPFTAGTSFGWQKPPLQPGGASKHDEIVSALETYRQEAEQNRRAGLNSRDDKWEENLNLYWNRYDFSDKARWQAQETMPEVPAFVDRFASAMKEALVANPNGFYTVTDPYDTEGDLTGAIKRMTDVWLSTAGRNQLGQPLGFETVFEEQMKLGAIMATSATVTWKGDVPNGRVAIETVDPRFVWLDHTYRNLYRIRRVELDRHDLMNMAKMTSKNGKPIFNLPEMEQLVTSMSLEDRARREQLSGTGQEIISGRTPVVLDEYIATVVDSQGELVADKALMVVANGQFLIRGPEPNPYWHGKDWLTYAPLVTTPLSVYGRSYMEDFGSIAKTFTELTNMILDATAAASMKAFVMVPQMLEDPTQINSGIYPNKVFRLEEGFNASDFAKELDLGSIDPSSVEVWKAMKAELSEAAFMNEIAVGQFAPNSRTSATEISATQQSTSAVIRSIAQTVETRLLNPMLDLTWKTGLQHASRNDMRLAQATGPELYEVLLQHRKELIQRPTTFQARGISMLIQKNAMLQSLLNIMQIIAQNENLLAAFMQRADMEKFMMLLFDLSNIDFTKLEASQRQRQIQELFGGMQERAANGNPSAPALKEMGDVTSRMGIGR